MRELLEELLRAPGAPGYEERVRALVAARLPPGIATATDAMGNLVATAGAGDRAMMFVAHMDEIGFVVSEVREDGFLRIRPLGGIDPRTVLGRALRIVTAKGEILGVVGVRPPHLMADRAKEMAEVPAVADLHVDVGARSRDEARGLGVEVLDFAVLDKTLRVLNGKYLCCRALDDRLGCAILLEALRRLDGERLRWRVHFAFSVQEEVGLRGAELLARRYPVDMAFAVDSTSSGDFPAVRPDQGPAVLGRGACLRVLDNAAIVPPAVTKELRALAEAEGIPLQVVFSGGGTDAGAFQAEGPRVMPIGFPLRYTHSAVELAHEDDVESTVRFVCAIVRRYAGGE
jgi:putative aminopeptidase FrvX